MVIQVNTHIVVAVLDTRGYYYLHDDRVSRKVMIFAVDMSSSVQLGNKGKDILILGKGPEQGLNHTLIAEIQYSINFTRPKYKILFKPPL